MSDKPIINLVNGNTERVLAALRVAQGKAEDAEKMVVAQNERIATLSNEVAVLRGLVIDLEVSTFTGGPTA